MEKSQSSTRGRGKAGRMMNSLIAGKQQIDRRSPAVYPALATLRLGTADYDTLARQGFVCAERRGGRTYFKIRFRRQRRQVVKYLGSDARFAARVGAELVFLQNVVRQQRELTALTNAARRQLRVAKQRLEPLLAAQGLKFHGLAVRRPRKSLGVS